MERPDYIPADYPRIKVVGSLSELFNEEFGGPDGVNCILFPRSITEEFRRAAQDMDFDALAYNFSGGAWIQDKRIRAAMRDAGEKGATAGAFILDDIAGLKAAAQEKSIVLSADFRVSNDATWTPDMGVTAFHVDTGPAFGRILCCYNEPTTEWIRNEDALMREGDNVFDPRPGAPVYSFRAGDIWRQASRKYSQPMDQSVQSLFIHRKPESIKNRTSSDPPRLTLVMG